MSHTTHAHTAHLIVDLAAKTGAPRYGASGFLYGLGDDGVPSEQTLAPIRPQIAAQKAPGGFQHPNGDAFKAAAAYKRAGGRQIQIYIQDYYPSWPYDNLGLDDYLGKVEGVVRGVVAHPLRELFAYVPFNEPDLIWYSSAEDRQEALRQDWLTLHWAIRELDPTGPIVGPNFANYHEANVAAFMAFCKEHGCLPEIVSWHELHSGFYANWYRHYEHYRSIERDLGIAPRAIAINEYANFMDLSVPGQLVQWVARFEHSKVDACLAYWHAAGDLCNLVTQNNQVTGGWWLYKWYADLTGHTVQVTPPSHEAPGLQGIAALDAAKRQARVVFGGAGGPATVVVRGLDTAPFLGDAVRVQVWSTEWTGVEGPSRGPTFEFERDVAVNDGAVVVALDEMQASSAYLLVVAPRAHGAPSAEERPWRATFEAEEAEIVGGAICDGGSLATPNKNYCSGGRYVSGLAHDESRVAFAVAVPVGGAYRLDIFYANGGGGVAEQRLRVDDGEWRTVTYPPNVGPLFIDRRSLTLALDAGAHTITLAAPSVTSAPRLAVDLDKIDLTLLTEGSARTRYSAELATLAGSATVGSAGGGYTGLGYAEIQGGGAASAEFVVSVEQHGFYEVALRYAAGPTDGAAHDRVAQVVLNGALSLDVACPATPSWEAWFTAKIALFLAAGINRIAVALPTNEPGPLWVDFLEIAPGQGESAAYEAEAAGNTLGGTAAVAEEPYASGGRYVAGVGDGAGNFLQFNDVLARRAGPHKLIVHYANAEKIGAHDYNVNIVDRGASISVNGGPPTTTYFRNTFGWNAFRSAVVDVQLEAGANTLRFWSDEGQAPLIDKIEIAEGMA